MEIRWNFLIEALILVVVGCLIVEAIELIFGWIVRKIKEAFKDE